MRNTRGSSSVNFLSVLSGKIVREAHSLGNPPWWRCRGWLYLDRRPATLHRFRCFDLNARKGRQEPHNGIQKC